MSYVLSFKAGKCTVGSAADKAVLRCLCDYANDDGSNCRPSTETISLETECDRRTVFKAIAFLVANGWIKVFSKGRGARNFYAINVEKIEAVYQQSKGAAEQIKFESGDKNVTTSSSNNATSSENDTSYKNAPRVVSILSESGDKNVTQLSQTQSTNNNINTVDTTSSDFELTADDAEQKKSAVKKTRPITHSFDLKEIPVEWKSLCEKLRPDLEPYKAFVEFQFYWQDGAGANTKRSDSGWRTTWLNYLKSPRTQPTPRPTPRPQTFGRPQCLEEPAGGYTTEFYESQMSWEEMNEKRRNGEL